MNTSRYFEAKNVIGTPTSLCKRETREVGPRSQYRNTDGDTRDSFMMISSEQCWVLYTSLARLLSEDKRAGAVAFLKGARPPPSLVLRRQLTGSCQIRLYKVHGLLPDSRGELDA